MRKQRAVLTIAAIGLLNSALPAQRATRGPAAFPFDPSAPLFTHSLFGYNPSIGGRCLAVADMDDDGDIDAAIGGGQLGTTVLINNGSGCFSTSASYPTGGASESIGAGLLDNDLTLDLAVVDEDLDTFAVLIGSGDGTFAPPTVYSSVGAKPVSLQLGDLDNDGDIDAVVACQDTDEVVVLTNDGNSTFSCTATFFAGIAPKRLAVAYIDTDPYLDVAVTSASGLSISINNGDATFAFAVPYGSGANPQAIATGDVNGDGYSDVVTANFDSDDIAIHTNGGTGSLLPAQLHQTGGLEPISLCISDLDSDQVPEIMVGHNEDQLISVLFGASGYTEHLTFHATSHSAIAAADVDGDHRADVVMCGGGPLNVILNAKRTGLLLQEEFSVGSVGAAVLHATLAKFNSDNREDLLVTRFHENAISVLPRASNTAFGSPITHAVGVQPCSSAASDLDNDGDIDVAVANSGSSTVSVLMNSGSGAFESRADYATGAKPQAVVIVDVNLDGSADLAVANTQSHTLSVLLNAAGVFAPAVSYGTSFSPMALASADVDGDHDPDLVVANKDSAIVSVHRNNGSGGFAPAEFIPTGWAKPQFIRAGDLDSDGDADIILAHAGSLGMEAVSLMLNDGSGAFTAADVYGLIGGPEIGASHIDVGDFDRDRDIDIVVAAAGRLCLFLNDGAGVMTDVQFYQGAPSAISVVAGDMDQDQDVDFVSIGLGDGLGAITKAQISPPLLEKRL